MTDLDCSDNPLLEELPKLPDSLKSLHVRNVPCLGSLPRLPKGLQVLHIAGTGIGMLPKPLPPRLEELQCRCCSRQSSCLQA
jgi:hypothetical protein